MLNTLFLTSLVAFSALARTRVIEIDACTRNLSTGLDVPEIHATANHWRTRRHLTAQREYRAVPLAYSDSPLHRVELFSFAIPVYRELYSGNLARLLTQIAAQTIDPRRVQVALVVNNTFGSRLKNDAILTENRQTVRWLEANRHRWPFRLVIVDETNGFERNMGKLRNRAVFAALAQTRIAPHQQVVVNFDADGTIPADYLERLAAYYDHFAVDAVIARRGHTVPEMAPAEYFQIQAVSEWNHLNYDVQNAMTPPRLGFSTPQITVRADRMLELGGFRNLVYSEDADLGQRLKHSTILIAPDVHVTQSDRAREDGFDAANRSHMLKSYREGGAEQPEIPTGNQYFLGQQMLSRLSKGLEDRVGRGQMSSGEAVTQFQRAGKAAFVDVPLRGDTFMNGLNVENVHTWVRLVDILFRPKFGDEWPLFPALTNVSPEAATLLDLPAYLMRTLPGFLHAAERRRFDDQRAYRRRDFVARAEQRRADVRALIRTGNVPDDAAAATDPFRYQLRQADSPLRRDVDRQIRLRRAEARPYQARALAADIILDALTLRYPHQLDPSAANVWTRSTLDFRTLNEWFLRAQLNPEAYPGTSAFLALQRPGA